MSVPLKRIAVTGAAGQIAYSLLFRIASGALFGDRQPLALHLLEIPDVAPSLEGVRMELQDCAFPLLREVKIGHDPKELFADIDVAFLVGAKPRGPGMERADLLNANGKIFVVQGQALDAVAKKEAMVVVVGNPCNTNCLIAMSQLKRLSIRSFHAMTRLDENRTKAMVAAKVGVPVEEVSGTMIWGNHSSTQVPDIYHATVGKKSALECIGDEPWVQGALIEGVQKRGAAIIATRGKSSAASAAQAAIDHCRALWTPTPPGHWFSMAVSTNGNPYGIQEGLVFSFPCRSSGKGDYEIVPGFSWNSFIRERIRITEAELIEERQLAFSSLSLPPSYS